jgi:hypothetical protein
VKLGLQAVGELAEGGRVRAAFENLAVRDVVQRVGKLPAGMPRLLAGGICGQVFERDLGTVRSCPSIVY